jgi:hypothetical protein
MDNAMAATLKFPSKDMLLGYARRVLAAAERAVDALDEQDLTRKMNDWAGYIVEYTTHDEWDIGQIAGLRRAQGLPRAIA